MTSLIRAAPSSIENSVWRWRWTKESTLNLASLVHRLWTGCG
jgi:hypothetical protein